MVDLDIQLLHSKIQCLYLVVGMAKVALMNYMNILLSQIHSMKYVDAMDKNQSQDIDMKHLYIIMKCIYLEELIIHKLDLMIYILILLKIENG